MSTVMAVSGWTLQVERMDARVDIVVANLGKENECVFLFAMRSTHNGARAPGLPAPTDRVAQQRCHWQT